MARYEPPTIVALMMKEPQSQGFDAPPPPPTTGTPRTRNKTVFDFPGIRPYPPVSVKSTERKFAMTVSPGARGSTCTVMLKLRTPGGRSRTCQLWCSASRVGGEGAVSLRYVSAGWRDSFSH